MYGAIAPLRTITTVGGCPSFKRAHFSPSLIKGVVPMVTYEELFLLGTLLVSIIALVINITKKK